MLQELQVQVALLSTLIMSKISCNDELVEATCNGREDGWTDVNAYVKTERVVASARGQRPSEVIDPV
ncbi:hypothetical protein J6590_026098 [Homalodisca vitripennis]|nr:hypothetical protein J6590_026098 [Homalodisca vitripennis]